MNACMCAGRLNRFLYARLNARLDLFVSLPKLQLFILFLFAPKIQMDTQIANLDNTVNRLGEFDDTFSCLIL